MAGGPITVTDRISVRVSAKNQEQSAANKKAVGGAIGKTLGNEDISDELKTQLGNTTNPVVYDEDGNAWISMEDIIAAGKSMYAAGAFDETIYYRYGNVNCVSFGSLGKQEYAVDYGDNGMWGPLYEADSVSFGHMYFCRYGPPDTKCCILHDINNGNYWLVFSESSNYVHGYFQKSNGSWDNTSGQGSGNLIQFDMSNISAIHIPINDVGVVQGLTSYGDYHEERTGGSLIDWTKTDEEIARDIQELHDTWDISEHPGGATRIDYVLAGPIEFNPGD